MNVQKPAQAKNNLQPAAQKSPSPQSQGFEVDDQRPETVVQRKLIQLANNGTDKSSILPARSVGPSQNPIQRQIDVKSGESFAAREDLPENVRDSLPVQVMADAQETYLAKSLGDLRKRSQGEESQILSPHRHLIGEQHDQSQFSKALKDWGWGADKMAESFQTSTEVTDQITVENQEYAGGCFSTNYYFGTKELENLHPFVLQGLSMIRFILTRLVTNTRYAKVRAQNIALGGDTDAYKDEFNRAKDIISEDRSELLDIWASSITPHIDSYIAACELRLATARGVGNAGPEILHDMATEMADKWAKLKKNIKVLSDKSYGVFDSWIETYDKLRDREANLGDFLTHGLDAWTAHLVNLTKADAQIMAGDNSNDAAIDQGWANAQGAVDGQTAVTAIGDMRELFMRDNINSNLNRPGIVQIGSAHVVNLNGQINHGKYHGDYDAFVQDTKQ